MYCFLYSRTNKSSFPQGGAAMSSWRKEEMNLKFSLRKKVWTGLESGEENCIDRSKFLTPTTSQKPIATGFGGKIDKININEKTITTKQRSESGDFLVHIRNTQNKKLVTDHFLR